VLVTAGGTAEPVDGVRVLTNTSTGATGAAIADRLAAAGHEVLLLRAHTAARATGPCQEETFMTFAELENALDRLLGTDRFDTVIHAAAVSDYGVDSMIVAGGVVPAGRQGKIESVDAPLLRLRPHPKLVDGLRRLTGRPLTVVAFKLTHGADRAEAEAAVRRLLAHSGVDYVVHNDLTERTDAEKFPSRIHRADGSLVGQCPDRAALASALEELLTSGEKLDQRAVEIVNH
jgi:phosphopantothenoylcysteine synthetase/decarboxylase